GFDERWARWCRPDAAIANSRFTAGSVRTLFPGLRAEVVYCPFRLNAVEPTPELRHAVRAELATPADARVVVQAGGRGGWKGHRLHLRGVARLGDVPGWVLWLAGGVQRPEEAGYLSELKQLAAELGIAERVRFLGHRRDVPRLLAAADVVCHPNE